MKELVSLLSYIFDLFKKAELQKAMAEDRRCYEQTQKDGPVIRRIEHLDYGIIGLSWCFVSKGLEQASRITRCRDYFNESLQAFIKKVSHTYRPKGIYKEVDTETLRFLLFNADRNKLENALEILKVYSDAAGWQPTTAIKAFLSENFECSMIQADGNWIRYPQLLSVFLLIIRLAHNGDSHITKPNYVKNVCDLDAYWQEIIEREAEACGGHSKLPNDYSYLKQCYKYLMPLFMHEKEIFDKEMPKAWQGKIMNANSGIHSFISGAFTEDHRLEAKRLKNFYNVEVRENEQKASRMYDRNGS